MKFKTKDMSMIRVSIKAVCKYS